MHQHVSVKGEKKKLPASKAGDSVLRSFVNVFLGRVRQSAHLYDLQERHDALLRKTQDEKHNNNFCLFTGKTPQGRLGFVCVKRMQQ